MYRNKIAQLEYLGLTNLAAEARNRQAEYTAKQERRDNLKSNPYHYHSIVELIDMARAGDSLAISELRTRN